MSPFKALIALAATAIAFAACSNAEQTPERELDRVILTTFYPVTWMAERIVGDAVPVECPIDAGADPVMWMPSRDVLQRYQDARLVLVNGANFERWLKVVSLPASRVVVTTAGFRETWITRESVSHSHGGGADHTHAGIDGHTWLDPVQAKRQADAILGAVVTAFPEQRIAFERGHGQLCSDLDALHARFEQCAARVKGATILCSHPAYDYVARRYGWSIESFDFDPSEDLDSETVATLGRHLVTGRKTVLLWESAPSEATVKRLRDQLEIESVVFSPCESPPADGADYLTVMQANVDRLAAALDG